MKVYSPAEQPAYVRVIAGVANGDVYTASIKTRVSVKCSSICLECPSLCVADLACSATE